MTPSRSRARDRREEAMMSEYEKKQWGGGCSINFLMSTKNVPTQALKLTLPMIMYNVARLIVILIKLFI